MKGAISSQSKTFQLLPSISPKLVKSFPTNRWLREDGYKLVLQIFPKGSRATKKQAQTHKKRQAKYVFGYDVLR